MAREGVVIEIDGKRTTHPALLVFRTTCTSLASLSTKLRLALSARTTRDTASTKASAPVNARRPWSR